MQILLKFSWIPTDLFSKFFFDISRHNTNQNVETLGYLYMAIILTEMEKLFHKTNWRYATACNVVDPTSCVKYQAPSGPVHPEQARFMSSVDCHVQYQAQKDNNNYVAIVHSHKDSVFSLSKEGFQVLLKCTMDNNTGLQHLHNSNDVYVNAIHVEYNKQAIIVVDDRFDTNKKTIACNISTHKIIFII